MNVHEEFYNFRDKIWSLLENLVQEGCEYVGAFPVTIGHYTLPPNGNLRTGSVYLSDTTDITIYGIKKDINYRIHPSKESEKDISVTTNKITVVIKEYVAKGSKLSQELKEIEVTPDILDLQTLSTYLSGGYSVYDK